MPLLADMVLVIEKLGSCVSCCQPATGARQAAVGGRRGQVEVPQGDSCAIDHCPFGVGLMRILVVLLRGIWLGLAWRVEW
jgi:hypothetical protein